MKKKKNVLCLVLRRNRGNTEVASYHELDFKPPQTEHVFRVDKLNMNPVHNAVENLGEL